MGQYYKFVNIDKKEICDRNRHGYKLMEHSYVSNDYCNDTKHSKWNTKKYCICK